MKLNNSVSTKKQSGFTIIELIVVATLLAVMTAFAIPAMDRKQNDLMMHKATEDMRQILTQARQHRLDVGSWPASTSVLVSENRIPASAVTSPYGTAYTLSVNAGNNLVISVDTVQVKHAARLAGADLPFISRAGTIISSEITASISGTDLSTVYSLDGSKPLAGDMNVNNYNVNNVNNLNANNVNTQTVNATGNITGKNITATNMMYSQNGYASLTNPTYIVVPDGTSNILDINGRNGTFNTITSTTTTNVGTNLTVNGTSNLIGNVSMGNNLTVSGNITNGGTINSTGNIYGPKFIDSNNNAYLLDPNGTSNILDITGRNATFTTLTTTGTATVGTNLTVNGTSNLIGNVTIGNNLSVSGSATVNGNITGSNITATNTMYSKNGFYDTTNLSYYVVPHATSVLNNLIVNSINTGNISNTGTISSNGDIYAPRFIDSNNNAYLLDPNGSSNILDITGRNSQFTYLKVTGNTDIGGNETVAGNSVVTGNVTSNNIIYSKNGFAALNNPSFIVVPDGTSILKDVNVNTLNSSGDIKGPRFVDSNNSTYLVDPSSTSRLYKVQTDTSIDFVNTNSAGGSCSGTSISVDGTGRVLQCISGIWTASPSGVSFATGRVGNGITVFTPAGYTTGQCKAISSMNSVHHGGGYIYLSQIETSMSVASSTSYTMSCVAVTKDTAFYDGGGDTLKCDYLISCSK